MKMLVVAILILQAGLSGCETNNGPQREGGPPKAELQFIDLPGFDKDLTGSFAAALPRVDVGFYDRITPSALPERLQNWLGAVESGGGTVKVIPPKAAVTNRSPLLILSALSSLWTASKMARELAGRQQFKAAQAYDAELVLKTDDKGETVVDKVLFVRRQR